jgi:hypothetical protein
MEVGDSLTLFHSPTPAQQQASREEPTARSTEPPMTEKGDSPRNVNCLGELEPPIPLCPPPPQLAGRMGFSSSSTNTGNTWESTLVKTHLSPRTDRRSWSEWPASKEIRGNAPEVLRSASSIGKRRPNWRISGSNKPRRLSRRDFLQTRRGS